MSDRKKRPPPKPYLPGRPFVPLPPATPLPDVEEVDVDWDAWTETEVLDDMKPQEELE